MRILYEDHVIPYNDPMGWVRYVLHTQVPTYIGETANLYRILSHILQLHAQVALAVS